MKASDNLIKVFTGSEILVNILKGDLEESGVYTLIKNDSITAYLESSPPPVLGLYIQERDLKKAEPVITGFLKTNVQHK
jgi:hypothetical protein